jgi:hypothetical protein
VFPARARAALSQRLRDQVAGRARRHVGEHVVHDPRERVLVERGREPDHGDQRGHERERELERERAGVAEAVGGAEAVERVERELHAPGRAQRRERVIALELEVARRGNRGRRAHVRIGLAT